MGPRQCGKTTLSKALTTDYDYYNYDALSDREALLFQSLDLLTYVSPKRLDEVLADQSFEVSPYDSLSYSFIFY